MRILFWSGTFWPHIGGVEVLAAKFLPAMRERGYEFVVIAPKLFADLPDEESYEGIPVHRFLFRSSLVDKSIDHVMDTRHRLLKLKRAFTPDIVHINAVGVDNFFHLTTASAHRAATLVTLHGKWSHQADITVGRTLKNADWVVGCSAAILEEGRRLSPEITPRSSIIYNGVELPSTPPKPLRFHPPRILCLGRLTPEKGFDLVIAAFSGVVKCYPRARLIIAGDGPERKFLADQVWGNAIEQSVEFCGWVSPNKVPALIESSTIVVMPSRQDSFPLVALEAAVMARPLVATRVGGLPEIVENNQTGLLVEKEQPSKLTEAMLFLLDHSDKAVKMGEAARQRVNTLFSWKSHLDAYDRLYQNLKSNQNSRINN